MTISRRKFLATSATALGAASVTSGQALASGLTTNEIDHPPIRPSAHPSSSQPPDRQTAGPPSFDPWLEIDPAAFKHNIDAIARLTGGRPLLAVTKNNAYGLGLQVVGPLLEQQAGVWGLAVVRVEEALTLRAAGVKKPILMMGPVSAEEALELANRNVRLSPMTDTAPKLLAQVASRRNQPVVIHPYIDTGMNRMGMPVSRAATWVAELAAVKGVVIEGAFTELTEDPEFDRGQAAKLSSLAEQAKSKGVSLGKLHAASSDAVWRCPEAHLDMIRAGFAVYGGYVTDEIMAKGELRCACRLKARVIRVERLEAGEGVSYHRRFKTDQAIWIAALAIGHVDGYPSRAAGTAEILIRGQLYPVIGSVSASHTIVSLGSERTAVEIGDEAILVGPDNPAIHPNEIARRAKYSEYDMFMHLNPGLRKVLL